MVPTSDADRAPIPPPAYHRSLARGLHLNALTLVRCLHLLERCERAVRLAQHRCPPPLPAGPGGAPRVYSDASLLLLALLRTLWRLSYRELRDWLCAWPALTWACGLPCGADGRLRVPSKAQQSRRQCTAGAPASELLFVLLVRAGLWMGLTCARDLILDSAPILAWRPADPDAAVGHAPAHHPRPLLRGYRLHTLLCRGSGLPLLFRLSPANVHDAPFACPLLELAVRLFGVRPRVVRLDARDCGARAGHPWFPGATTPMGWRTLFCLVVSRPAAGQRLRAQRADQRNLHRGRDDSPAVGSPGTSGRRAYQTRNKHAWWLGHATAACF